MRHFFWSHLIAVASLAVAFFWAGASGIFIGALALIMLVTISTHVPEYITGLVGAGFILLSLYSSIQHNKRKGNI